MLCDTHTHTNNRLSPRCGRLGVHVGTLQALIIFALTVFLLELTSCGSPDRQEGATNPTSPLTGGGDNLKGRATIDLWSDAGVYHNALCHIVDDSLAVNFAYRFNNKDDYIDWAVNEIGHDYAIDVLGSDADDYEDAAEAYFETDEADRIYTNAELSVLLVEMVTSQTISQRESNFIQRGRNILNRCYQYYPFTQIQDSLDQWKTDILNINWGTNETTIVNYMSIEYYSFSFWLNEGFDHTNPPDYDPVILRADGPPNIWQRDVDAYNWAVKGGADPWTARIFAAIASSADFSGYWWEEWINR